MTATLGDVPKEKPEPTAEQAAEELVRQPREAGPVADWPGRAAEAADQNGAGAGAERLCIQLAAGTDADAAKVTRALASIAMASSSRQCSKIGLV
jgi:hypothetical protein